MAIRTSRAVIGLIAMALGAHGLKIGSGDGSCGDGYKCCAAKGSAPVCVAKDGIRHRGRFWTTQYACALFFMPDKAFIEGLWKSVDSCTSSSDRYCRKSTQAFHDRANADESVFHKELTGAQRLCRVVDMGFAGRRLEHVSAEVGVDIHDFNQSAGVEFCPGALIALKKSVAHCEPFAPGASSGSGATFAKTSDNKHVVKKMKGKEAEYVLEHAGLFESAWCQDPKSLLLPLEYAAFWQVGVMRNIRLPETNGLPVGGGRFEVTFKQMWDAKPEGWFLQSPERAGMLSAMKTLNAHKEWLGFGEVWSNLNHTLMLLEKQNLVDFSIALIEFEFHATYWDMDDRDWLDSTGTRLESDQYSDQYTHRCIRQHNAECQWPRADRTRTCAVVCFWIIDYFGHRSYFTEFGNSRQDNYAPRTASFAKKLTDGVTVSKKEVRARAQAAYGTHRAFKETLGAVAAEGKTRGFGMFG